ncbi:MAG: Gll1135 protein, partial [uncultured Acidimicrobiales bacterium]
SPLLHQGPPGGSAVARDPPGRGLPHAPPHEPDLLRGQVLRLPAQGQQRPAQPRALRGGPLRGLVRLGQGAAAEGPDQPRGLDLVPVRQPALPPLLQELQREGLGRPGQRDLGRLGGAAHQEPLPALRHRQRPAPEAEPEGHRVPHRGVPVPEVRAGDDVGAVHRARREGRHPCGDGAEGHEHPPRRRQGHRGRHHRPRRPHREPPVHRGRLLHALPAAAQVDGPPAPGRGAGRRRRAHLPRLPHRRPRGARALLVPRQLDLRPLPAGQGRPHPELRVVVAVPHQGGPHLPRPRVLRVRGRRRVEHPRRRPRRAREEGAVGPRPGRAGHGRGGLRRADAQGVPDLRRLLQGQRRRPAGLARGEHTERAPGGAQRHAQVQQPGPLDADRHADRREHPRRLPRHLDGQRRGGLPRGEGRRGAGGRRPRVGRPRRRVLL